MLCYQYNYNGTSSSILLYFKFGWCLSELSFSEVSCREGTCQLIRGANHLTDSCMVHGFAGGGEGRCFRTVFHCLTFLKYLSLWLIIGEFQCVFSIYPLCLLHDDKFIQKLTHYALIYIYIYIYIYKAI